MKIGLFAALSNPFADHGYLSRLGPEVESRGFESIWVAEHVVLFDDYSSHYPYSPDGKIPVPAEMGMLEPLSCLAFLAACTSTVRLATGILLLPQRNPVYTAKEVANIDWLSGGRVDLGIGIGWLEEEFDAVNVPWPQRGKRTDEYIAVMRSLWEDDASSFSGDVYDLPECRMYPKPVQAPLPIHVGGESDAAMRRAARQGQGWYGFNRAPDDVPEALDRLDRILAEEGRGRSDIEVTICPYFAGADTEAVKRYADAGVDRVNLLFFAPDPEQIPVVLDQLVPAVEAAG
jgi:probable F420-dependent oxidoreductase